MLLSRSLARRLRRSSPRRVVLLLALVLLVDSLILLARRPAATPALEPRLNESPPITYRNVFIASVHTDTAPLLHRSWSNDLLSLVDRLGPDNVYVSIVEFASRDATRTKLRQLQGRLDKSGVPNTVRHGTSGWQLTDELRSKPKPGQHRPGWIWQPDGTRAEMRWIPRLALARNQAMEPLAALAARGKVFDRVLWVDDVVFTAQDAIDVLDTRNGNYAAACSVDTGKSSRLLETSALRDDQGRLPISSYWPWFRSPTSVSSIKSGLPTRVYSCWNGLIAFQAAPFYADPPLRFRSVADDLARRHIEGSERCLIHADNPLSASQGVWLNPSVRVTPGRNSKVARPGRSLDRYPSWTGTLVGSWANRLARWTGAGQALLKSEGVVQSRVRDWLAEAHDADIQQVETDLPCLVSDMQVVRPDGWAKV
ncbi:glycosyltransferase family protein [Paramyrothecium foliicola]|nr:glycosyltransferase family protein [Paramyrothecium foliicola]